MKINIKYTIFFLTFIISVFKLNASDENLKIINKYTGHALKLLFDDKSLADKRMDQLDWDAQVSLSKDYYKQQKKDGKKNITTENSIEIRKTSDIDEMFVLIKEKNKTSSTPNQYYTLYIQNFSKYYDGKTNIDKINLKRNEKTSIIVSIKNNLIKLKIHHGDSFLDKDEEEIENANKQEEQKALSNITNNAKIAKSEYDKAQSTETANKAILAKSTITDTDVSTAQNNVKKAETAKNNAISEFNKAQSINTKAEKESYSNKAKIKSKYDATNTSKTNADLSYLNAKKYYDQIAAKKKIQDEQKKQELNENKALKDITAHATTTETEAAKAKTTEDANQKILNQKEIKDTDLKKAEDNVKIAETAKNNANTQFDKAQSINSKAEKESYSNKAKIKSKYDATNTSKTNADLSYLNAKKYYNNIVEKKKIQDEQKQQELNEQKALTDITNHATNANAEYNKTKETETANKNILAKTTITNADVSSAQNNVKKAETAKNNANSEFNSAKIINSKAVSENYSNKTQIESKYNDTDKSNKNANTSYIKTKQYYDQILAKKKAQDEARSKEIKRRRR